MSTSLASEKMIFAAASGKKLTAIVVKYTDQVFRDEVQYDLPHEVANKHLRSILRIPPPPKSLGGEAVVARNFVPPEVLGGSPDFMDGEGAFFNLPPLGVHEDFGEAFVFFLGAWVQCVLGRGVLVQKAVSDGLQHCGLVVHEEAGFMPHLGDGAPAVVGLGVVEVVYGIVGEFLVCTLLMVWGNALLSVGGALLQVRLDVGSMLSAVLYVVAGLWGVSLEAGCQVSLRMPESIEHISWGRGRFVVPSMAL